MDLKTVALTGGIGSGKTAVAKFLASKGIPVYDSDSAAKFLYDRDADLVRKLEEALGVDLRLPDGHFDKKALASKIFSDPDALSTTESIVHPAVLQDFLTWKALQKDVPSFAGQPPFVIMESAIVAKLPLFKDSYDALVLVTAPDEMRIRRVMERDGLSREKILSRMAAQSFDITQADAIINNDLDFETLHQRTEIAFKILSLR